MSLSSSASPTNPSDTSIKKRRLSPFSPRSDMGSIQDNIASSLPQGHIPKRGARACTSCRKGKNRCEGEAPCRRCQISGTPCVFEKPEKKKDQALSNAHIERLSRLEGQYLVLQSQMIGMQSSLDRILSAVQTQSQFNGIHPHQSSYNNIGHSSHRQSHYGSPQSSIHNGYESHDSPAEQTAKFPVLPGFAPPPHKYATYGIGPSSGASSEDESEDTLPRSALNAPIEALQDLANAAAEAAAAPASSPRMKKRKRVEPTPTNAFPHVVAKGMVSEAEARELFNIFFSGCHFFFPLFDPTYDTYDSLQERTPWTFDAVLAIASKIRSGTGPLSPAFYKCLDEAQGIARSSMFGPVVRKEAVMGMLLLAGWSTNGWIPSGHAMRMALELGLHRALDKLAEDPRKRRTEEEERDLVVSARIWLCLYWFDHQMSLGTGRPIVLRDEASVRHCRILLNHPMSSHTDVRLVSQIELIAQKTQIYETLSPLNGQVNHNTLAFIRRANLALEKWYAECDDLHSQTMDEESLLRKVLAADLHYAKLWLVCVALRGVSWDKMPFEQRELAFQAKDAACDCLNIFLTSPAYRAALRYAIHDTLVAAAFSALFLLKMANLFPTELDLASIIMQVEQLAQLFSDSAAGRYALTLQVMLANLRRKVGIIKGSTATIMNPIQDMPQTYADTQPLTMEELNFQSHTRGDFNHPAAIPLWLQEQSLTDLGIPVNGHDGIFLQPKVDCAPLPEPW